MEAFVNVVSIHRLLLYQYKLGCLENYKIYDQYHCTTTTSVLVPMELSWIWSPSLQRYHEFCPHHREV